MVAVLMAPYVEPSLVPVPGHPPDTSTTPGQREVSFPLASFTFSYTPSDTPATYIFEITNIIAPFDTFAELTDTNIVAPAAGQLAIYDATAGVWDNAALGTTDGLSTTAGDGAICQNR